MIETPERPGLRIAVLTAFLPNYQLIASWAERHGHEIVLTATPRPDHLGRVPAAEELLDLTRPAATIRRRRRRSTRW